MAWDYYENRDSDSGTSNPYWFNVDTQQQSFTDPNVPSPSAEPFTAGGSTPIYTNTDYGSSISFQGSDNQSYSFDMDTVARIWDSTQGSIDEKMAEVFRQTGASSTQVLPWVQSTGRATNAELQQSGSAIQAAQAGYPLTESGQFLDQNSSGALGLGDWTNDVIKTAAIGGSLGLAGMALAPAVGGAFGGAETGAGLSAELAAGAPELAGTMGLEGAAAGGTAAGLGDAAATTGAYGGMDAGAVAGLDTMASGGLGGMAPAAGTTAGGLGTAETLAAGTAASTAPDLLGGTDNMADTDFGSFDPGGNLGDYDFDWSSLPTGMTDIFKNALAPGGMNWLGLGSDLMGYSAQRNYQGDLIDTMNRAIDKSDPFASQRPMYQDMYKTANTDPNWLQNDSVLQNLQNAGRRNTENSMAAKGYLGSGNILHELQRTGTETAAKYALPRLEQLGQAAGVQSNPAAAGQAMSTFGPMAAQAGIGQMQSLQSMLGRLPRGTQNTANNAISGGLNTLFGLA